MTRLVDRDLDNLREQVLRMGGLAEAILEKSLRAVQERSELLCAEVQRDDLEIDRLDIAIDDEVLKLLATQAPVARDLRFVLATKATATDLERVGDLARNIAKCAARLAQRDRVNVPPQLEQLASQARRMLRLALNAYADLDAEAARRVLAEDDTVDADEANVVRGAIAEIAKHPEFSAQEIDLILIAKHLERVADHATNIAEDAILVREAENLKHAEKLHAHAQAEKG